MWPHRAHRTFCAPCAGKGARFRRGPGPGGASGGQGTHLWVQEQRAAPPARYLGLGHVCGAAGGAVRGAKGLGRAGAGGERTLRPRERLHGLDSSAESPRSSWRAGGAPYPRLHLYKRGKPANDGGWGPWQWEQAAQQGIGPQIPTFQPPCWTGRDWGCGAVVPKAVLLCCQRAACELNSHERDWRRRQLTTQPPHTGNETAERGNK